MQPARRDRQAPANILRIVSALLVIYGAAGVAVQLRLLPLGTAALASWFGLPDPFSSPAGWSILAPLEAHYGGLPWLPWAAWLAGVGILVFATPRAGAEPPAVATSNASRRTRRLAAAVLVVLLVIGGYTRLVELWPQSYGLTQFPYDDEGVYAGASQLFLQGALPYRDYFFAHPPLAAISYAPAMAYHFNEWGSPTSFMMARYLSVAYSLVTLALLFAIGWQLAGLAGGTIAGGLWALDGRVVEINRKVMLDGPMVLLSCAALCLYLWARPVLAGETTTRGPRRPVAMLGLAGALGAMSALTKVAGVACLIALAVDLLWLHLDNRRLRTASTSMWPQLVGLAGGALAAAVVVLAPFAAAAPSNFVRDVIFFQLLRPNDGLVGVASRIADITSSFSNVLTAFLAGIGFIVVSLWVWRKLTAGTARDGTTALAWRVVVLWTFLSVLLFTYSRSFYSHYFIQLAAPLCVLGAGASLLPRLAGEVASRFGTRQVMWARVAPTVVVVILALPLLAIEWNGVNTRHEDRLFEIVGRYVGDAVPPGTAVLTTDEQFNFLAARPPSRNDTGYLVDSYGHLIALGLGLYKRDWGDLLGVALRGEHASEPYSVMQSADPQADLVDRASKVPLVVIHSTGRPRFTPQTMSKIETGSNVAEQQSRYTIYRVTDPQRIK